MARNETGKVNRGQDLKELRSRWWVGEKLDQVSRLSVKDQYMLRLCGSLSQLFDSTQLYCYNMKADIVRK